MTATSPGSGDTSQLNVRLPRQLKRRIAAQAQKEGRSAYALATEVLTRYALTLPHVIDPRLDDGD